MGGLRTFSENIQDQIGTVEDHHLQLLLDVAQLLRRQLIIEDHHTNLMLHHIFLDLL